MYEYRCIITNVVDGDTVDVDIDLGFGVWMRDERVRVVGIDAPESRTSDKEEKMFGIAAKQYVASKIPVGSNQVIRTTKDKTGKFGRILGDFVIDDTTLTEKMLKNHHAVPYKGQSKKEIRELHMINRQKLIDNGVVILKEDKK